MNARTLRLVPSPRADGEARPVSLATTAPRFTVGPLKGRELRAMTTAGLEGAKVWLLKQVETAVGKDDDATVIELHRNVRLIDAERKRRWANFLRG